MAESLVSMLISFVAGWSFVQVGETLENVDNDMHVCFKMKTTQFTDIRFFRGMLLSLNFLSLVLCQRFLFDLLRHHSNTAYFI